MIELAEGSDNKPKFREQFMIFDEMRFDDYTVYCLIGPTGKKYYGISGSDPKKRWRYGKGYNNRRLEADIKAYSFSGFEKVIIAEHLTMEAAEKMEKELIARDRTDEEEFGYNVQKGSDAEDYDVYVFIFPDGKRYVGYGKVPIQKRWSGGYSDNPKLKAAIKAAGGLRHVKKEHFKYPLTKRSAIRIEATLINFFQTCDPSMGYNKSKGAIYGDGGWKHTEEAKRKISEKQKKRPVRCIDTREVYESISEASMVTGADGSGIRKVCAGKQITAGGYKWEFVDEV